MSGKAASGLPADVPAAPLEEVAPGLPADAPEPPAPERAFGACLLDGFQPRRQSLEKVQLQRAHVRLPRRGRDHDVQAGAVA
jgi:hypothetical protein